MFATWLGVAGDAGEEEGGKLVLWAVLADSALPYSLDGIRSFSCHYMNMVECHGGAEVCHRSWYQPRSEWGGWAKDQF